jgi:amidohydrolase
LTPFLLERILTDFLEEAKTLFDYTRTLRRDFHRHPELGFQEIRTAGIVSAELNKLGLEVRTGIAETGVVALLEGASPGPTLLLRFDMDALPVEEETGAQYASQNPGVMHACGHDAHTAIGLTVARLLHDSRARWNGQVKLVFQPAEEGLGGAQRMVDEGVLHSPRPDMSMALHVWNEMPFGRVGVASGPTMASASLFKMRVTGVGTHAALPHKGVDPILAAAQIVSGIQSISSRNVSPLDTSVVSVTKFHAGDAFNVLPLEARLGGTVRTYLGETQRFVERRLHELAGGIGKAMGCEVEIEFDKFTPAVVNDPHVARQVQQVVNALLPGALDPDCRTMASEDMALMMDGIPGCYFFVGSADPARGLDAPHHSPRFDIDERVLPQAAGLMASAAAALLGGQNLPGGAVDG